MKKILLMLVWWPLTGWAQDPMSLKDAVHLALNRNKSVKASDASRKAAESRIAEARSGNLPKVNYSESWTRSDNPVFVFSSLLTQHQFGEQNFQIGPLNRPDFLNNFQSQVTADQTLYDGGQTRHAVRSAELTKDITIEDGRRPVWKSSPARSVAITMPFWARRNFDATSQAMRSAQADLERAESVRSAGMSTDVDVLSIRVHLAGVREQQIRREADLDVARAALNDALGLPLDTTHTLTTGLAPLRLPDGLLADYEKNALGERPEARQ
jgi:outer membrane protein